MSNFQSFFNSRSVLCLPLVAPWGLAYRCWYLLVLFLDLTYTAFIFPYNEAWRIRGCSCRQAWGDASMMSSIRDAVGTAQRRGHLRVGARGTWRARRADLIAACLARTSNSLLCRAESDVMYKVEAALGLIFILDVLINMHTSYVLRFKNEKM